MNIMSSTKPIPYFLSLSMWVLVIQSLLDDSMNEAIPTIMNERESSDELKYVEATLGGRML